MSDIVRDPYGNPLNRDKLIIALRAEVKRLKEWNREIALNAREFAAENERLRAALEPLACTCDRANGDACSRAEADCAFWIARAALEER